MDLLLNQLKKTFIRYLIKSIHPRKYMTEIKYECSLYMLDQVNYLTRMFLNFLLKELLLVNERQDIFLWCGIGQL